MEYESCVYFSGHQGLHQSPPYCHDGTACWSSPLSSDIEDPGFAHSPHGFQVYFHLVAIRDEIRPSPWEWEARQCWLHAPSFAVYARSHRYASNRQTDARPPSLWPADPSWLAQIIPALSSNRDWIRRTSSPSHGPPSFPMCYSHLSGIFLSLPIRSASQERPGCRHTAIVCSSLTARLPVRSLRFPATRPPPEPASVTTKTTTQTHNL